MWLAIIWYLADLLDSAEALGYRLSAPAASTAPSRPYS
ncbi:hypothetical protein QFZ30_001961 [Arthrobacter pascens]|nr:hypothetical protein [Arthrobacter pascens]